MLTMPLLFSAFRVSLLQIVGIDMSYFAMPGRQLPYVAFTGATLGFMCVLGVYAPDLTLITRLKGSICGMTVSVMLPGVMFLISPDLPKTPLYRFPIFLLCLLGFGMAA